MGNDVQMHESAVERAPGEERRASPRHAASVLGSVNARIIGGSPVELVNFSSRGVLFECDSRLLIGARASVRITTTDANLIVTGRVVRSRVKGLVNGALRYDAALALDSELALMPAVVEPVAPEPVVVEPAAEVQDEVAFDSDDVAFESESEIDGVFDPAPVEAYLAESDAALAEVARVAEPEAEPVVAEQETVAVVEPEPEPVVVEVNVEATLVAVDVEPAVELAADEPIAFEADAEIAFEPAADYEFEAAPGAVPEAVLESEPTPMAAEPAVVVDAAPAYEPAPDPTPEPEPASMFDATYRAPADEVLSVDSQFEVTPPSSAYAASSSSVFDARPSETYNGSAHADAEPVVEAAAEAIDFESEVAFEAVDAVMFEPAYELDGVEALTVAEPPPLPALTAVDQVDAVHAAEAVEVVEAAEAVEAVDVIEVIEVIEVAEVAEVEVEAESQPIDHVELAGIPDDLDAMEPLEPIEEGLEAAVDPTLPADAADDRALHQFSATRAARSGRAAADRRR